MPFHQPLYDFWLRSTGVWVSPLVIVNVRFLEKQEIFSIGQIHNLEQVEFGVNMLWEYRKKTESGYMSWCVDACQPNLVFTNKGLTNNNPCILNYQLLNANKLIITVDKLEETFILTNDGRRLRELRYEGKLLRRLREKKVDALSPKLALAS